MIGFWKIVFSFPWKLIRNVLEVIVCCRKESKVIPPSVPVSGIFTREHWALLTLAELLGWVGYFWSRLNGGPLALIRLKSFCIFCWLHTQGAVYSSPVARKAVLLKSLCFPLSDKSCGPWLSESTALKRKLKYGHHLIHKPWYFFCSSSMAQFFTPSHSIKIY